MSLLRLLTAGKSLIGVPSTTGRYKLSDPRSMPKFRSTVNPFKSKTANADAAAGANPATPVVMPIEKAEPPQESHASERPAEVAEIVRTTVDAAEQVEPPMAREEPSKATEMAAPTPAPVPIPAPVAKAASGWISKVSSLKNLWSLKGRKPEQAARPVQGELSLDNIKVVRNDLSETDLEVVPLKSSALARARQRAKANESSAKGAVAEEQTVLGAGQT